MSSAKGWSKAFVYLGVSVFAIYAAFIRDNKDIQGYALIALAVAGYYAIREEWQSTRAREEKRLSGLFERVHYLEIEKARLEREHLDLASRVEDLEHG